jgi:phosphatidylserine/phosphatidylglycerophosphate/cardiolipin synthase-like enzyme
VSIGKSVGRGAGLALACALAFLQPRPVEAATLAPQERLCDPSFQDCRADILTYINQETVGIDIGFWMMTDARYSNALVAAWQRGVRIRVLMDPRCVQEHSACDTQNDQLQAAGIPMRNRATSGILHWKMILFAGQGQLEFAGANYAPFEMAPDTPYVNYTDEVVYYTNQASLLQSFMRKFDDLWTSTTEFTNYANVSGPLMRLYPTYAIDPELNFPPDDSYRTRAINAYNAETLKIDVQMFRITDERHSDAMIAALNRGVAVRLITDETEYRNPSRLWDAYNVDKMYHAGVAVRLDAHQGIDHEKAVILYGTGMSIIGSSNWTSPSSDSQREHNLFTTRGWIFTWLQNQFNRKWKNSTGNVETKAFVPLPPDVPVYATPANGATGLATTGAVLKWNGGLWAHLYDIYFGTSSTPPLLSANQKLGPSQSSSDYKSFALPTLQPGTTYYWKIVSKTMAYVTNDGPVWSFTTAGTSGGGGTTTALPSGWSTSDVGSTGAAGSASYSNGTFTVTGAGADVWGTADAFRYAYTTLAGDGSIVARVASVQYTAAWAKAGVMVRGSLSSSSAHAFMLVSAGKGVAFQRRTAGGGTSTSTAGSLSTAPRWVKLTRTGSTLTAYESADGNTWQKIGSDTIALGSTAYIGLAVSSHVNGVLCTATFDHVTVQ